ncbi:hypothetical protein GCM10009122_36030 [Fulvivirga kasyanovii]|uniref:DUF1801 domain-containing protein n=1 Tax=Fulvivirga kasyanovii TaxID=396812 RepID=A0ABW9RXT2_9BACT|nr:DUF1801 domain-containing protein [Fulvivirga kasyanovii]MTI28701.1 DUF1801 domain-containing protein [Fulvivirga kasyanovii]
MSKIQKVDFRNIDDFLDYLPENELAIVERLRTLVLETIPEVKEKLAYNVPFYYRHYRLLYLWPAAVPWGGLRSGVSLGFCYGSQIDDGGYLNKAEKKQTASKNFKSADEIDTFMLRDLIYQSVEIDNELFRQKRTKTR